MLALCSRPLRTASAPSVFASLSLAPCLAISASHLERAFSDRVQPVSTHGPPQQPGPVCAPLASPGPISHHFHSPQRNATGRVPGPSTPSSTQNPGCTRTSRGAHHDPTCLFDHSSTFQANCSKHDAHVRQRRHPYAER
ncbi:hypothetical protein C8Q80DRAFT_759959 [Daedaleopsis nitida]|nr:hypothetical protein C8Q80DRAFT_759959 [Daedaleopsis nitida]